jgi:hypothetical protein
MGVSVGICLMLARHQSGANARSCPVMVPKDRRPIRTAWQRVAPLRHPSTRLGQHQLDLALAAQAGMQRLGP